MQLTKLKKGPFGGTVLYFCKNESLGHRGFLNLVFAEKLEHLLLVYFDTWLVERIDVKQIAGHAAGNEEEVDHIAKAVS